MKKLMLVTALALLAGPSLAQDTGPAQQSGMDRPGMTSGTKESGAMNTTGMSTTKGSVKRDKEGASSTKHGKK